MRVHAAMHAITIQIPAQRLNALSQRDDVVSITPNRTLQRTLSTLESVSGGADDARPQLFRPDQRTAAWTAAASASPCSTRA